MVLAVQCPNDKCRKYQLVEDSDRGKIVHCLICKAIIKVSAPTTSHTHHPAKTPPPRPTRP